MSGALLDNSGQKIDNRHQAYFQRSPATDRGDPDAPATTAYWAALKSEAML
jgi:hypothetical protein